MEECKPYTTPKEMLLFFCIIICAMILWFYNIELYGDMLQYLPLFLGIYMLCKRKYKQVVLLCIVSFIILGVIFAIKYGFYFIEQFYGAEYAEIGRRPINNKFTGFPSGHTGATFIAIGVMLHFYPKKWCFLWIFLAFLVPVSRIITGWHTPLQVFAGGLIGVGIGYFLTLYLKNKAFFQES